MTSAAFILAIIALVLAVLSLTPWSHPALLSVAVILLAIIALLAAKG